MSVSIKKLSDDVFEVTVAKTSTTTHTVTVTDLSLSDLSDSNVTKTQLLEFSFRFLLEREPNTSIQPSFNINVISKYFSNYKDEVIFQMELYITNCCLVSEEELTQRRIRKVGYKTFTMEKYGFLGQGNRVKVPDCVTFEIRKLYPEEDSDEYMGYKPY